MSAYERKMKAKGRAILAAFARADLRRALWLLRREHARPHEPNAPAAQYDAAGIGLGMVRHEYRRQNWKLPKPTHAERP